MALCLARAKLKRAQAKSHKDIPEAHKELSALMQSQVRVTP
jgi:hypothetical protein